MGSKKFLKIPAVAIVLGILVVGGASAALVNYLSNTLSADVEVERALDLKISGYSAVSMDIADGTDWGDDVSIPMPAYQGESAQLNVSLRNKADANITARPMATWGGTQGVTVSGDDFAVAQATTGTDGPYDMASRAQCVDWYTGGGCKAIAVCYGPDDMEVPAHAGMDGNPIPTVIDLELVDNIQPANYTFEVKMVPPSECPSYADD